MEWSVKWTEILPNRFWLCPWHHHCHKSRQRCVCRFYKGDYQIQKCKVDSFWPCGEGSQQAVCLGTDVLSSTQGIQTHMYVVPVQFQIHQPALREYDATFWQEIAIYLHQWSHSWRHLRQGCDLSGSLFILLSHQCFCSTTTAFTNQIRCHENILPLIGSSLQQQGWREPVNKLVGRQV